MQDNNKRLMAIDYGRARVGVAISDPSQTIARGLETIEHKNEVQVVIARLLQLIAEYHVEKIILGLPARSDGKPSAMELEVKQFSKLLQQASGLRPLFRDERFTSVQASRLLSSQDMKQKKQKAVLDQVAAELILTSYLDELRLKG